MIDVASDDNAHVLLDFGDQRFANVMTGFTMQKYRSPAIELYGTDGVAADARRRLGARGLRAVAQRARGLGGAPRERADVAVDVRACGTSSTASRRARPTVTRPEHAWHALEVMLAASTSAAEGRFVDIDSDFPAPLYPSADAEDAHSRRKHDPRTS